MKINRFYLAGFIFISIIIIIYGLISWRTSLETVSLTKVKFGMLPYADHSYAIIGIKQDWFKDVGIDIEYRIIKVEEIIPLTKNGTIDIVSSPPGILFASYENAPELCSFVFGDLFQGYAVMAQPNAGYLSYQQFIAQGLNPGMALKATITQMKGKVFAYPTETAIKPFIDLVLEKAQMTSDDIVPLVLDDPLTINAMREKRADFQVGGVPSRIILQREGYVPILSAVDIAVQAQPSAKSKELASILQNGWATRKDFYYNHRPTLLRMASVNYRIMKFMNTNIKAALTIHMPFLSQITGQSFTSKDGEVIYKALDPFVTFEGQKTWFHDKNSPLYFEYVNGSIINSYKSQNIYKVKPPDVNEIIFADDIYNELDSLRRTTEIMLNKIQSDDGLKSNESILKLYQSAKHFYDIYDYYDSDKKANECIKKMSK